MASYDCGFYHSNSNVSCYNNCQQYHYSSNRYGIADIDKSIFRLKNDAVISCVGYRSLFLSLNSKTLPDTVKLSKSVTALKEVKITTDSLVTLIPLHSKKAKLIQSATHLYASFIQYIPNEKEAKGIITSATFFLNNIYEAIDKPFMLRLYTKNKNNIKLGDELTTDSIIVYNPERKEKVVVDVSKYNIQLPENGVFVVFQILDSSYYSKRPIYFNGQNHIRTPGLNLYQEKNAWGITREVEIANVGLYDRKTPFAMVGPEAQQWNWNDDWSQWYIYNEGCNFAVSLSISKD